MGVSFDTAEYSRTYGYFSDFDISCVSGTSDAYFTPNITEATVPKAPAPSVSKVTTCVYNAKSSMEKVRGMSQYAQSLGGLGSGVTCFSQPSELGLVNFLSLCVGAKVYILVRSQMKKDHEDAWKKLFVVAFVAIIVATVSLQVGMQSWCFSTFTNRLVRARRLAAPLFQSLEGIAE